MSRSVTPARPASRASPGALPGRTIAAVEWFALGLLVVLFAWKGFAPAWAELNTDFPNYYLAARLYRAHYPLERVYDWVWFQRQKDHAGIDRGIVGYFPLSPFSALVVAPLVSLSPLAAKQCWLCVNLVLLAATIALLHAMTRLPARRVALVAFLAVVPLRTSFQFGQQHLLMMFLLTLAGWMYQRGREVACGTTLAIASALKLYPALFALFFLLKYRWRALASLCVGFALLVVLGVALFGLETMRVYATCVLPRAASIHPYNLAGNSTTELLRRLFLADADLNPHPLVIAPTVYLVLEPSIPPLFLVSALWLVRGRRTRDTEMLEWGAFVALLLVLSPGSSTYHFCVLILATVLGVDFLARAGRAREAAVLVAMHALVCFPFYRFVPGSPSGWNIFLGAPRLYALLLYWGVFLWTLARLAPPRPDARVTRVFALAFVALAVFGIASNVRHFAGQTERSASRLPESRADSAVTAPAVGPESVYFSRRASEAYVLERTGGTLVARAPPRTDLFHPAVNSVLGEGWVEVSSQRSHIARFALEAPVIDAARLPVEVEDAEQPVISADGRWLAFLRERGGRGSLWVADRRAPAPDAAPGPVERQVVDASHDVLDFAFYPDDRIVLAARSDDGTGLFVTSPTPAPVVALPTTDRFTRYPAISPDGRWLAYGVQEHGVWQLHVMDLVTNERRLLTHANCNSVTPAWMADSTTVVYANDCDRGLGETTLWRIRAVP